MIEVRNLDGEIIATVEGDDPSEADFSYMDLPFADFRGWNLVNAFFDSADLHGADFTGANLEYSSIRHALNLDGTVFTDAVMPHRTKAFSWR